MNEDLNDKIKKGEAYLSFLGGQIKALDNVIIREPNEQKKLKYTETLLGWLRHYQEAEEATKKDLELYFKENKVVSLNYKKLYKQLTKDWSKSTKK